MKARQAGFTLIELVMVIVILGILAASFAPKFLDMSSEATAATQKAALGAAKSGIVTYLAKNQGSYPSMTALAGTIDGASSDVSGTYAALSFDIDGTAYLVYGYSDDACTTATGGIVVADVGTTGVQCVSATVPTGP